MAAISVQIRPDKKKKDGSCPIVFRLYHHRNYFYSSGYAIHEKFWDKEKELVKAAHPLASNLNRYIQGRLLAINIILLTQCDPKVMKPWWLNSTSHNIWVSAIRKS